MTTQAEIERIRAALVYNPKTGVFYRIGGVQPSRFGPAYLRPNVNGYLYVAVGGKEYLAHRVAWLLMAGYWPEHEIDHKNRIRTDNRWKNLRAATRTDNLANSRRPSASGLRGAYLRGRRFHSQIVRGGKQIFLGSFATAEEANAAYLRAAKTVHGEFATDGKTSDVE